MAQLILENDRYQLFMRGYVARWTKTGTSDHYYDYEDHYHQWRGAGVVVDKKTDQLTQFEFTSPASRFGNPAADLKTLVLRTDKVVIGKFEYRQASTEVIALPGQESRIVSFVCERLLDKVAKCADPIKGIFIDDIPFAELASAGIVADGSGQVHLGFDAKEKNKR